ncbi:MAG: hypothetical protein G01um101438_246 [Parcubacteria group bacterium Gr01-1014_38]|nr:MAG: hypothetical protein G01um101438_246 [Parcubacteria group bacterium Gr01-1014_38]
MSGHSSRTRDFVRPSGFTLLGVLISALFIVLVVSGLALTAQRTGQAARATKERMLATMLAREGVELVRAIRDNNWLSTPRCPTTGRCEIYWRGQASGPGAICNGTFRIDADNLQLVPASAGSEGTRLSLVGTRYHHGGGTPTPFRRWVIIASPEGGCGEPSVFVPNPSPASRPPQPFVARVIVVWDVRMEADCTPGRHCVELREDLYPWMNFR